MIGDLIPRSNVTWQAYLSARKLMFYISTPSINNEMKKSFKSHVKMHYEKYINFFKKPYKPKQHNALAHYVEMIDGLGLPRDLNSIRYGGKHKEIKDDCKMVSSRKNICKTIAIKQQLRFNSRILAQKGLQERFDSGPILFQDISLLKNYKLFQSKLNEFVKNNYKPL